jgi:hypothetical protein
VSAVPARAGRAFRAAAAGMSALFALSVAVQWNDPDPLYWMGLYGIALVLAAQAAFGRLPLVPNVAALALFAVLAARALPQLLASREEAFSHWHMLAAEDEVAREAGGLLLCALWSAALTAVALRARPQSRSGK